MPWRNESVMSQREEFVRLALAEGANRSELCRRFGVSRDTAYKWLVRSAAAGRAVVEFGTRRAQLHRHEVRFRAKGAH